MTYQYGGPETPAQYELFQLWSDLSRRGLAGGVRRSDLDPGRMRRHLARVVVLEVLQDRSFSVRLAGSTRCQEVGFDPSGRHMSNLPEAFSALLSVGAGRALEVQGPVAGRLSRHGRGPETAFLRLPLLCRNGVLRFMLCHDEPVTKGDDQGEPRPVHDDIHGAEVSIAA